MGWCGSGLKRSLRNGKRKRHRGLRTRTGKLIGKSLTATSAQRLTNSPHEYKSLVGEKTMVQGARRKELSRYTKDDLVSFVNRHDIPADKLQVTHQAPAKQELIRRILAWELKTGRSATRLS